MTHLINDTFSGAASPASFAAFHTASLLLLLTHRGTDIPRKSRKINSKDSPSPPRLCPSLELLTRRKRRGKGESTQTEGASGHGRRMRADDEFVRDPDRRKTAAGGYADRKRPREHAPVCYGDRLRGKKTPCSTRSVARDVSLSLSISVSPSLALFFFIARIYVFLI